MILDRLVGGLMTAILIAVLLAMPFLVLNGAL
jgi:hypothetical protein